MASTASVAVRLVGLSVLAALAPHLRTCSNCTIDMMDTLNYCFESSAASTVVLMEVLWMLNHVGQWVSCAACARCLAAVYWQY
jgi:hypothetical protein